MRAARRSRRPLLIPALGALLLAGVVSPRAGAADPRPNILLAIADDWGWPHAGVYGDTIVHTPTFDRLSREGLLCRQAYVSAPSCTASRAALLTGQWHWRLQSAANLYGVFPDESATYPELLAQAGYEVGMTGKGYGPGRPATAGRPLAGRPFPSFQQFIRQRDPDKPFCFWLGSTDPHRPYELGVGSRAGLDVDHVQPFSCLPNVPEVRSDLADYYWAVQRFDQLVGAAVQTLTEIGELDKTIIVMTSDNGMPFPRCKANLYDGGVHVPLAIRWGTRIQPARVVDDFVSLTDLAPTFLDAASVPRLDAMTGRSLMDVWLSDRSGQVDPARDGVLVGKERHCPAQETPDLGGYPCRAIRTHEFLYIRNFAPDRWPAGTPDYTRATYPGAWLGDCDNGPTKTFMVAHQDQDAASRRLYELAFGKRPAEELYDLKADPGQLENVAARPEYLAIRRQLSERLERQLRATGDPRVVGGGELFDTFPYEGGAPRHPDFPESDDPARLPAAWQAAWQRPPLTDRPLQIVHGIPLDPKLADDERAAAIAERLDAWQSRGLGGIVCNVPFTDSYLQSADDWTALAAVMAQCRDRGLVVWIYDELGYPSGAAGGLVLKENPAYEALELAWDATRDDPFVVRPSYEFTHANNNYHASRRYINLLDAEAVACFVRTTHDAYAKHLAPYFGDPIVAMFTDEPSLLAVSLGQIPEHARRNVRVQDPPDPRVQPLPAVPWCRDMEDLYRARFGEDLRAQRRSLFEGDADTDRRVRRQFWSLVADLISERFFGALEGWCEQHRVASSGHTLVEESLLLQLAVEGNGLQALSHMQIPGLDMLSSDPETVIHNGWLTAAMPASAAAVSGRRRVMTEVSDFAQRMAESGPAGISDMRATAAWQAAWGVTEFTLYYSHHDRSVAEYRRYCDFVGRLNAIVKPAARVPDVLLYYPMYDLWSEYRPVAQPLELASQSPKLQQIVASFMQLGQSLQRHQIPFVLIDHRQLAGASIAADGTIVVGGQAYRRIVLPEGVQLPQDASDQVELVRRRAPQSVWQREASRRLLEAGAPVALLQPAYSISPASPHVALGQFVRDGRPIVLVVNVGREGYEGRLSGAAGRTWHTLDPINGAVRLLPVDGEGCVPLRLAPLETQLMLGSAPR